MTIKMPNTFTTESGVFFINVRVPADLAWTKNKAKVAIPIGDSVMAARITDKVFVSLRTKDIGSQVSLSRKFRQVEALRGRKSQSAGPALEQRAIQPYLSMVLQRLLFQ